MPDNNSVSVAELSLSYLIKNGDLYAGDLLLKGQTLYVAAGQGDLQLFDVAPWLDNRYRTNIELKHYFSVTGAVNSFAFGDDAIYAGTSFVYVDDEATENPLEVDAQIQTLGGGLNTIVNDQLIITEQVPQARGHLNVNDAVEIQFNTLIDPALIRDQGSDLLEVTLSNQAVSGFVSARINNTGSRIIFRPTVPFEAGKEYRVTLFAGMAALNDQVLSNDYSFRFVATDEHQFIMQQISPVFGGWQGGYSIVISGENLLDVQRIDLGENSVIVDDFIEHSDTQIVIAAPALSQSPDENKVVGMVLVSNDLSDFQGAAFTYIADPKIRGIGKYDPESQVLDRFDHAFHYGVSEFIGVDATGISAATRVFVNGIRQNNVELRESNMLILRMPSNTLGDVTVTLDNKFEGNDSDRAAVNTDLSVYLLATNRLNKTEIVTRHDSLLLTAHNNSPNINPPSIANLYTTRDSEIPTFLATINPADKINSAALSGRYIVLNIGERQELQIYDISNIYAPERINALLNPALVQHGNLQLFDDTFVSRDGNTLNVGYVRGSGWLTYNIPADVLDIKVDSNYIYLLTDLSVEVHALREAGIPLVATYFHSLINPESMQLDGQHLLLYAKNKIELVDNSTLPDQGIMRQIGDANISGISNIYSLHGELIAANTGNKLSVLELSTVDNLTGVLTVSPGVEIANVDLSQSNNISNITFDHNILEWLEGDAYYAANIPLLNAYAISPEHVISEDVQRIKLAVTGSFDEWQNVILDVRKESQDRLLAGNSNILGHDMSFTPIGDVYELGESYSINVFNQPESNLSIAANIDLPWRLLAAPLFGIDTFQVSAIAPASSLTNAQTDYIIKGSDLQSVNRILFNDLEVNQSDWSISADGNRINISAAIAAPGLYNLVVEQPGQRVVLPAALLVQQAITVNTITADNNAGSNRISDSGNTTVTLTGLGFAGPLDVHIYEANSGLSPASSNKVRHWLSGNNLRFTTPPAIHDHNYQVVLIRNETGERIDVPDLLTGIDDTRPIIQAINPLTFASALQITANESITATGFSVVEQFRDYSSNADQDISNQFELAAIGNEVFLRTKLGVSLSNNRIYQLTVNGIQDSHGNTVVNHSGVTNGRYTATFTSSDLLSPGNQTLKRKRDNANVDAAMTLTRGRTYEFIPSAEDNLVASSNLRYEARISTNNGLSFGARLTLPSNTLANGNCSVSNTNNLCISILSSYQDMVIRLKVFDPSGNFSTKDFAIHVIDPVINIGSVFTTPSQVDELSRADIQFNLGGDVDLLNTATMSVLGVRYPVNVISTSATTSRVSLSYIHPRLSEIAPSDQILVKLELTYGFDGAKSLDDQYKLFLDITPPTINIVSPGNGDRIVLGDQTDILFKVFDRFAIETVEASINGGAFTETAFPNRYSFTPLTLDPVTIAVRATDANGNQSAIQSITVQPYDATLGEPTVNILSPANGSEFHEGEDVTFELQMLNVTDAQLFFDIGGVESDIRNPAPVDISRAADAASRFALTAALPVVGENIVVVARLQSGNLQARQFINLVKDDGISEIPILEVTPSTTVLTGTEVMLRAIEPANMTDFSDTSVIEVNDPVVNTAISSYAYDGQARYHHVSGNGTDIRVSTVLRDRSGFEKRINKTLLKQPYFGNTAATLVQLAQDETLLTMVNVANINQTGDDIFWALNKRNGGYRIESVSGVVSDQNNGEIVKLVSSGAGLFAEVNVQGQHRLLAWTIQSGALTPSLDQVISGNLIDAEGYQIFVSNGQAVIAYILEQGSLLPVIGESTNESIISAHIDAGRLFVLSETGLYIYHIDIANDARLVRDAYLSLPAMDDFSINGDQLYIWGAGRLFHKQILTDYSLVDMNEITISGEIKPEAVIDGDITWLLIENGETRWYGYKAGELIAILNNNITAMLFDSAAVYQLQNENNISSIVKINLITENIVATFAPQLTEQPLGILIDNITKTQSLGGEELVVMDQNDLRLPVTQVWKSSSRQWFIRRADLNAGELHIARVNRAGNIDTAILLRNETTFSLVSRLHPENATSMTQGAIIPLTQVLDATARAENQSVSIAAQTHRSIAAGAAASSQWTMLSDVDSSFEYEHQINGLSDSINNITLLPNQAELDAVVISQPANNAAFTEGQQMEVRYRATQDTADTLNYVHIRLLNFNRELVSEIRLTNNTGKLQIRLPEVTEQSNFLVNIRAYYGTKYRYSESEVGIRINPKVSIPAFKLQGLSQRVMLGSRLSLSLDRTLAGDLTSSIFIYDQNDQLLASDEKQIDYQVTEGIARLRVLATISDDFGNSRNDEQFIDVIDHFRFIEQGSAVPFNSILPGVGSSYFAQGRTLVDNTGQILAEFNSTITAMAHLGDRIILALENIGLIVVNPFDVLRPFRQLSNEPLNGKVSKLLVKGDKLAVIVDGKLKLYDLDGNAIEPSAYAGITGTVFDVINHQNHFVALSNQQLVVINDNGSIGQTIPGRFTAMLKVDEDILLSSTTLLSLIDSKYTEQKLPAIVDANRLLLLGGDVIALNNRGEMSVIDIREISHPDVIGRFDIGVTNISNAVIAQGQLWLGGSIGQHYSLQRQIDTPHVLYQDALPRGIIRSVALKHGNAIGAADYYGSQIIDNNNRQRTLQYYPAPRTGATHEIVVHDEIAYLRQDDNKQIVAYNLRTGKQDATAILANRDYRAMTSASSYLVASSGSELYFANHTSSAGAGVTGALTIEPGNEIVALTSRGDTIFVSTQSGVIYRVRVGALPITDANIKIDVLIAASGAVRQLITDGDYLIYAIDADLHRLRLLDKDDRLITMSGSVTALAVSKDRLFVGINADISIIDINNWALTPNGLTGTGRVSSIAAENNRLLIGRTDAGLELVELPLNWYGVNAALATPYFSRSFQQAENISLQMQDAGDIAMVNLSINGDYTTSDIQAPFEQNLRTPAQLRNGQPFDIRVDAETVWGEIVQSQDRRVLLQSLDQISNSFSVSLSINDIYIPVPLQIRATVSNSTQPIQQVEFYYSADINGPWELIGKHFGPDYVVYKNFDEIQNGDYIKARAIDIYGNFTETLPTTFERLADNIQPTAQISLSGTTLGGQPVGGHEYRVDVELDDIGSGIDYALLRRNNVLISAAFNNGLLSFNEKPVAAGDTLEYEVSLFDNSGNVTVVSESFTAVPDMQPQITNVSTPAQVREQSDFDVSVFANDDLAVKQIAIEWTGHRLERNISSTLTNATASFNVTDLRSLRVGTTQIETLNVFVTDSFGQVTQSQINIDVIPDTPPDASQLAINFPASGFFNENLRLEVSNIQAADDGGRLKVEIIELSGSGDKIISSNDNVVGDIVKASGKRDATKNNDTQFLAKVRLTDKFGQTDESAPQLITLTLYPNNLEFVAENDSTVNPAFIEAGKILTLATKVTDSANRPVPNQEIRWYLLNLETREIIDFTSTAFTASNGVAVINEPALFKTGFYRVFAELADVRFKAISPAVHVLQVLPGDPAQLVFEKLPPVLPAAELFNLVMHVEDAGGNRVNVGNSENVVITINEPRFQIAFANDVDVNYQATQVVANVAINSGTASLQVAASTVKGIHQLTVSYPDTVLSTLYDNDGISETPPVSVNALNLNVVAAQPREMQMQIVSVDNQQYGDVNRIEVDETVHVQLRLVDEFGNTVESTYDALGTGTDSDYIATLSATGNALINASTPIENITMTKGVADFTVQSSNIESVDVNLDSIIPITSGFDTNETLNINFLKLRPHIVAAAFETALDNTNPAIIFTYSEDMQLDVVADWAVSLNNNPEVVTLSVDTTSLRVELAANVLLNQCYGYDTETLEISALNNELEKLKQIGEVCSPRIAIPQQAVNYALETRSYTINADFATGIVASEITTGSAVVNGISQPFDWSAGSVIMPDITALGLADGSITTVYLSGSYLNEAVRVANGITVRVLTLTGDFDLDGLSNEFEASTSVLDPTKSDTDGDGIPDGDEDTDNDGISNIDEFIAGTDPENPDITPPTIASIVPADTSTNIDTQSTITVTFTEPLQTTSVTDGVIILSQNATETTGVTTLAADALSVSFKPDQALLGTTEYTISIQNVRDAAGNLLATPVTSVFITDVSNVNLPPVDYPAVDKVFDNVIGLYELPGTTSSYDLPTVEVQGAVAYVAYLKELYIIDISTPESPQLLGRYKDPAWVDNPEISTLKDVVVSGNYAYVATGSRSFGLYIIDISDPVNPIHVSTFQDIFLTPYSIEVIGNNAFIASDSNMTILDVSDPTSPLEISTINAPGGGTFFGGKASHIIRHISIINSHAFVLWGGGDLGIIDISDVNNPVNVSGNLVEGAGLEGFNDVAIVNGVGYIAADTGLYVYDLSDLFAPTVLATLPSLSGNSVSAIGNTLYIHSDNTFKSLDISTPTSPQLLTEIADGGSKGKIIDNLVYSVDSDALKVIDINNLNPVVTPVPQGLFVTPDGATVGSDMRDIKLVNNTAYVADYNLGLQILDVSDEQNIQLQATLLVPFASRITIENAVAYIISDKTLHIIDVTDSVNPTTLSTFTLFSTASEISVQDNIVYVSETFDGVEIINAVDPSNPQLVTRYDTNGSVQSVSVINNNAFVTNEDNGLITLDISDITTPVEVSRYSSNANVHAVIVSNDKAYIVGNSQTTTNSDTFQILDTSEITTAVQNIQPEIIGNYSGTIQPVIMIDSSGTSVDLHTFTITEPMDVTIEITSAEFDSYIYLYNNLLGDLIYIADDDNSGSGAGLSRITATLSPGDYSVSVGSAFLSQNDATNPVNNTGTGTGAYNLLVSKTIPTPKMSLLGSMEVPKGTEDIVIDGDFVYLMSQNEGVQVMNEGVQVINISDPLKPYLVAHYASSWPTVIGNVIVTTGIDVNSSHIFMPDRFEGLKLFSKTNDFRVVSKTQTSLGVEYNLTWTIDRTTPAPAVKCAVLKGSCTVTAVDTVNRTATVFWEPSIYSGDYGIAFALGGQASFISTRDSINWITDLGPEPVAELLFDFTGTITPAFTSGSLQSHVIDFRAEAAPTQIQIEVVSSSFIPHLYLLDASSFFEFTVISDAFGASPNLPQLTATLNPGAYVLTIGRALVSVPDVTDPLNRTNHNELSGPIGDGAYEITVKKLPDGSLVPPDGGLIPPDGLP
ncbi:MAG TPA: hypothetical protein ENJ13_07775 [Chromatiales bacterium]|nr:hypothetical protein [Chromatiales bacterium]